MGFRSTFITEDRHMSYPQWFRDRYERVAWFAEGKSSVIASQFEIKCDRTFGEELPVGCFVSWEITST